jgi:hypothetical protein
MRIHRSSSYGKDENKSHMEEEEEADRTMKRDMKMINKRIRRLTKVCSKLKSQLDIATQALECERIKLNAKIMAFHELDKRRKTNGLMLTTTTTTVDDSVDRDVLPSPRSDTPSLDDSSSDDNESYFTAVEEVLCPQSKIDDNDWIDDDMLPFTLGIEDDVIQTNDSQNTCPWIDSLPFMRAGDLEAFIGDASLTWSSSNLLILPSQAHECQMIVNALTQRGLQCIVDDNDMWIPDRSTQRILSMYHPSSSSPKIGTGMPRWYNVMDKDILLWSGHFDTDMYGSDLPLIKARGLIPCSAIDLMELLMDSSQVKAYNKMSVGRTDEWIIQPGIDANIGETKVLRSLSKIPLIRKPIEFWTLMHSRCLQAPPHMKGYVVVSRSLWEEENMVPTMETRGTGMVNSTTIRSEVLLSVNLIRVMDESGTECCELTTMNHMYSPCAPSIGAKQLALKAAYNFIRDLQLYFE